MFKFVGTPILIDFASYALVSQELGKNGSWEGQIYEFVGVGALEDVLECCKQ